MSGPPGELQVSGNEMSFIIGRIRGNGKPTRPGKGGLFHGLPVPPGLVGDGTFKLYLSEIEDGIGKALLRLYIGEELVAEYQGRGRSDMPGDYEGEWRV